MNCPKCSKKMWPDGDDMRCYAGCGTYVFKEIIPVKPLIRGNLSNSGAYQRDNSSRINKEVKKIVFSNLDDIVQARQAGVIWAELAKRYGIATTRFRNTVGSMISEDQICGRQRSKRR